MLIAVKFSQGFFGFNLVLSGFGFWIILGGKKDQAMVRLAISFAD